MTISESELRKFEVEGIFFSFQEKVPSTIHATSNKHIRKERPKAQPEGFPYGRMCPEAPTVPTPSPW